MGIARKHHTLPAFYLKRFADDKGLLSKWDTASSTWSPIRPKSASVEVDFYIVETEEGPSDAIENALSAIEGRAAEVIHMIAAGTWPIPVERKAQLAEFLSLQRVRGTGFRASVDDFTDRVADKVYYLEEMARYRREFVAANKQQPTDEELRAHSRTIENQCASRCRKTPLSGPCSRWPPTTTGRRSTRIGAGTSNALPKRLT
jgi:hypothetical protein